MKKLLTLCLVFSSFMSIAQDKKALTWDDILGWNRVTSSSITDDGQYISVQTTPWLGDATLEVFDKNAKSVITFSNAKESQFLNNNTLVVIEKASLSQLDSLERAKSKDKIDNTLIVYNLKNGSQTVVDSLKSYKVAKETGYVAYKRGDKKDNTLYISSPKGVTTFENVKNFEFSEDGSKLAYFEADSTGSKVYVVTLKNSASKNVYETAETVKKIAISNSGDAVAFVVGKKDDKTGVSNALYYYNDGVKEITLADNCPTDWIINEFGALSFSKEKGRLTYSTSPRLIEPDTISLKREKAVVDVWNWSEPTLHTVQLIDREKDLKKSYKAVYFTDKGYSAQLENLLDSYAQISEDGEGNIVLTTVNEPYKIEAMWEGKSRSDVYIYDVTTKAKELVAKETTSRISISPSSKYLYWYQAADSSWYSYSVATKERFKLTNTCEFTMYDHLNDVPDYPRENGAIGWSENDETFYVNGRYDLWALDPERKTTPKRITTNGKETNTTYRVVKFDDDKKFFTKKDKLFLSTFDNTTKGSGYAEVSIAGGTPTVLASGLLRYGVPTKAKNSDNIIFTQETFTQAPNIHLSTTSLKESKQLTDINPQQKDFNWGTDVELVEWVSLKGDTLQGLLFKPENFDPTKKYPMICNFYEKDSHNRFGYRMPETHRSTIDYHYYTSNGYVIFNPDVKYYDGYPGQSCYDAVMPGIDMVLEKGFVDPKHIGAQGHSWGGYQVAFLAGKTDRFAAIESGAPVVNMLSAYGGVRWATGLIRAFQYEHGQSRIGKSIWEAPDKYLENSPLMDMDKVTTPILIMHNDSDGHVPWWQGIEYFVALRRLQKPVWLLNYNDEPHWPLKQANQIDFQTRMSQFFHHYLKGDTAPEWMEKGVPAV
ncbi:MAG: prolyl oligopeptidase family serine peptidase, partial [Rikenellaceae bacterium]